MAAEGLPSGIRENTSDDDLLPIRALNDLLFCERRCVLHQREKVWVENRYTLEGTAAHRKVHAEPSDEELGGGALRRSRNVWLRSDRLKLVGVADLVEFHAPPSLLDFRPLLADAAQAPVRPGTGESTGAACSDVLITLRRDEKPSPVLMALRRDEEPSRRSVMSTDTLVPYPIEYKRGPRRRWDNDDVQLCAQALCLEEMLGVAVPAGAIFHFKSRRRREIAIDAKLRALTEKTVARLHELLAGDTTPAPIKRPRCRGCSLFEVCMPEVIAQRDRYAHYLRKLYEIEPDPLTLNAPAGPAPVERRFGH
jgi:CRISPR-associated exonuclease Cas4